MKAVMSYGKEVPENIYSCRSNPGIGEFAVERWKSWGWDRATAGLQSWFKMESHCETYPVFSSVSIHSKQ